MNQKLKRYEMYEPNHFVDEYIEPRMTESESGDYVLYSDYEKLEKQLAKSENRYEPTGRDTKNGFIELRQLVGMRYGLLIYPCGFKHEGHFITAEDAEWIIEQKRIKNEKLQKQLEKAEAVIGFYGDMDSWRTIDGHKKYNAIEDDDLGVGDFEQTCGPNHVLNSISDIGNGGKRARQYFKDKEETHECTDECGYF